MQTSTGEDSWGVDITPRQTPCCVKYSSCSNSGSSHLVLSTAAGGSTHTCPVSCGDRQVGRYGLRSGLPYSGEEWGLRRMRLLLSCKPGLNVLLPEFKVVGCHFLGAVRP
jgi:hypothetical protein